MGSGRRYQDLLVELGPRFAARAAAADAGDHFVTDNFADLKAHGFYGAGIPTEFGGAGLEHSELCHLLRELAHSCSSTALTFSMHTHQVATNVWRWRHDRAPVEGLLKRVAAENILLLSSGGSDWLHGSGTATKVEGGYRIRGRKVFTSGAPAGDLLMTSAVYEDPQAGPTVLHFAVPMRAEGVRMLDTWRVMGMRGTGSHDVELEDVFVADAAIGVKRPQGKWNPLFHTIAMVALPLIYAVYTGIAEAARQKVVEMLQKRQADTPTLETLGALENEVALARLALDDMIATAATSTPGVATTNRVTIGRTLVARGVLRAVDLAMESAGGMAFYRSTGLERLFRDAQAARYHPLRDNVQRLFAGRVALGRDVDGD